MKSKNIFITIMVTLFLLGACTEEKIIDGLGAVEKGTITLELAPSSIITKAGDTEHGYTYATEEELTVTSCWVYIVKGDNIVRKMYFSGTDITGTSGPYEDEINGKKNTYTKGYQVEIKNLDYGSYDFWVIANPSGDKDEARYANCTTLSGLKEVIEGADTYDGAFASSSKLIKYGNEPVVFNADFVKEGKKIAVKMTQLAARVEVTVKVDLKWTPIGVYYEYKTGNIFKEALSKDEAFALSDRKIPSGGGSPISIKQSDGYKYLGHPVVGTMKHYSVSRIEVQKVSKYEGYAITDLGFTIENIRTKSFVTVPAKGEEDSDDASVKVYKTTDFSFLGIQETYNIVFYTYNRKVDARNPLNVVLNGKIGFTKFEVKEKGVDTAGGYFVADKNDSYIDKIKNGELRPNEVIDLADNGWNGNPYMIYVTKEENFNFVPSGEPGEVIGEKPVWKDYISSFTIEAPKDITEGNIRNGNLYTVGAVIKTVPITGNLGVEIEKFKVFGSDIKFDFN